MIIPSNTKSDCYSYQQGDKPKLFSWSLEKEYYHIEYRLTNYHRKLTQAQQVEFRTLYRQFADLFLKYIQVHSLSEAERKVLAEGIQHSNWTVWVYTHSYIELLAYYEPFFKEVIQQLCQHTAHQIRERGLMMINSTFSKAEKSRIFTQALTDKSTKVRRKAIQEIWEHRLVELLPVLEGMKQSETNQKVLESIKFTRFYIDKPIGDSVTFTFEDMAAFKEFE